MKKNLLLTILISASVESNVFDKIRDVKAVLRTGIFSARVDVSEVSPVGSRGKYRTTSFIEYHDGPRGLHALKSIHDEIEYFYHKHKSYKNFFRVANGTCETLALNNSEGILFPDVSEQSSGDVFLGPTGFIASVAKADRVEESEKVTRCVRGIETQMWNISDSTDIIRIYFAVDAWRRNEGATNVSFPLRIEQLINNELWRSYEILQVEILQPDSMNEILPNLLPPFVKKMCAIQSPTTIPELVDASAMVIQTRNPHGTHQTKEWYDRTIEVFRCDQKLVGPEGDLRDSVISEISDSHRGLVYRTTMNTCEMVAVRPQSTRLEPGQLCLAPFIVKAFQVPNPFYIGKSLVRGLLTDVWQTNAESNPTVTARIYVSSDAVVSASVPRRKGFKLPLRVDFKGADPDNVTRSSVDDWRVDIFDYEPQSADRVENNFNIEDCSAPPTVLEMSFRSEEAEDFRFDGSFETLEKLTINAKRALLASGPISPLLVPYFRVTNGPTPSDLTAVFKVLNPPTYLDSFKLREDPIARYDGFAEKYVVDIETCAKMCIQGTCGTLIFCSDLLEDSCYLMESSSETSWGEPTGDETCDVYDRTALGKFVYHPVEEIEQNLKQAISSSDLSFEISYGNGTVKLQAHNLVKRPPSFSDGDGNPLFQTESKFYYIKPDHETSLYMPEIETLGDCFRNCVNNDHIACAVFSFCPTGPRCVFSSLNINKGTNPDPHQDEVLVPAPSTCAVYSVSFLRNFQRQEGRMRPPKSAITDKGFSASNCAFKCRQNKYDDLDVCRGFAYCEEQQSCSFYSEHDSVDDITTSEEGSLCDHYTLRFSADYTAILRGTLALKSSVDVFDVSVDECAQRCSEMSENVCSSFSHCGSDGETSSSTCCRMYRTVFDGTVRNRTDPNCTVYIRNGNVRDIIRPSRQQVEKHVHTSGLTDELFKGLLCAALLLGILIGVVSWNSRVKLSGLLGQGPRKARQKLRKPLVEEESDIQLQPGCDRF